ncbi:MAG: cyd operon YbgE family protein [Thiobacillus sp.]|nr:cyd operon YbgE family protein [Thiobacillus sp.]
MTPSHAKSYAQGITLAVAFTLMLLITIYPRALATESGGPISHGILMLIMWGLSAGFVYGVGFIPRSRLLRVALGPWVAWAGFAPGLASYLRFFLE